MRFPPAAQVVVSSCRALKGGKPKRTRVVQSQRSDPSWTALAVEENFRVILKALEADFRYAAEAEVSRQLDSSLGISSE